MKSFVAAGALLAALASAQSIADLPSCSLTCIVNGVSSVGCSVSDFTCSCDAADKLSASVTPCVQSACTSAADQAKVISVLEGICASVGIPITISAPGSGATSSAAPASSSAAPASSSEAPASSSAAAPASYSSAAAPASSSACSTSTTYTTVTASSGPYPTYGSNGTVTTSPPPAYTGAASSNSAVFGAAGLFGLLAYVL